MTFFLLFKCSKVCYWQEKIVNKGWNLLDPYFLTVLLSIPFYKLPCTMASFSRIFVVSVSVTHYKRLWIPRSWRHFFCLSDNSLFFSLIIPVSVGFLVSKCFLYDIFKDLTVDNKFTLSKPLHTKRILSWKKRRECTGPFHNM